MSKYAIKNVEGAQVAETELADSVFGIEPNISCIHQVVVCQDACKRQGTHSTKNRHDVSGGGAKPYRQKGTGRARQGSIHAKRVNHKMVKVAMRGVLSGKVADGELVLVDSLDFEKPSTKQAVAVLNALGVAGKRVTVVVDDEAVNAYLSFRNIEKVTIIGVSEANTRYLIDNGALVMTTDVCKKLEEVLA